MKKYKNYKMWIIIFILSVGAILSGCQKEGGSMSLINAPIPTDEKQIQIKKALDQYLPEGTKYIIPRNSEHKQAIFINDINKDAIKEAYVLYSEEKEDAEVHILVLKEKKGKWIKSDDIKTDYYAVDYVRFEDLDNDGIKEVMIGVGFADAGSTKQLLIYGWSKEGLVQKADYPYEGIDVADYDGDKKAEILIVDGEVGKKQSVKLLDYKKGKLQSISMVELEPYGLHENIVSGDLTDGKRALFIDSGLGAHSMLTEIVTYKDGKLIKVGDEMDDILFKAYPLYSKDINKDDIVEVGGMYIPKGYEDAAMVEIPFIYTYNDYNTDGTKKTIEQRYADNSERFYITIPRKWYDKVTVKKMDQGVRILDNKDQKVLFEVNWTNKKDYDKSNTKLAESKEKVFYTHGEEELGIPNSNFHLFVDDFE